MGFYSPATMVLGRMRQRRGVAGESIARGPEAIACARLASPKVREERAAGCAGNALNGPARAAGGGGAKRSFEGGRAGRAVRQHRGFRGRGRSCGARRAVPRWRRFGGPGLGPVRPAAARPRRRAADLGAGRGGVAVRGQGPPSRGWRPREGRRKGGIIRGDGGPALLHRWSRRTGMRRQICRGAGRMSDPVASRGRW